MHFNKISHVIAIVASNWQRDKNTNDLSLLSSKPIDLSPFINLHNNLHQRFMYLQDTWSNITDDSSSKVNYISSNNSQYSIDSDEDDSQKSLESFQNWWKNSTHGRSGLVIQLVPALASQFAVIKKITPYFFGITSQYIEPVSLLSVYSLSHNRMRHMVKAGALAYVCLSAVAMLFDLYLGGSTFLPFKPSDDSYTLITDATSDLGVSLTAQYFGHGHNVILVSKSKGKLHRLEQTLHSKYRSRLRKILSSSGQANDRSIFSETNSYSNVNITESDTAAADSKSTTTRITTSNRPNVVTYSTDLRNPVNIIQLSKDLDTRNIKVEVLINNLVNEVTSIEKFHTSSWLKMRSLLDSNIQSSVMLTRLILPTMINRFKKENKPGRVVFISSVASVVPTADVSLFAASQSFITAFAKSLRRECLPNGVAVTCILPSSIKHYDSTAQSKSSVHWLNSNSMTSDTIAYNVFRASRDGRNYIVPGWANKLYVHIFSKLIPETTLSSVSRLCWEPMPRWLVKASQTALQITSKFSKKKSNSDSVVSLNQETRIKKQPYQPEEREDHNDQYDSDTYATQMRSNTHSSTASTSAIVTIASTKTSPSTHSSKFNSTQTEENIALSMNITAVKENLRRWLLRRWEQPLIDYVKIKEWSDNMKYSISHPGRYFNRQSRQSQTEGQMNEYDQSDKNNDNDSKSDYVDSETEDASDNDDNEDSYNDENDDDETGSNDFPSKYPSNSQNPNKVDDSIVDSSEADQVEKSNRAYEKLLRSGTSRFDTMNENTNVDIDTHGHSKGHNRESTTASEPGPDATESALKGSTAESDNPINKSDSTQTDHDDDDSETNGKNDENSPSESREPDQDHTDSDTGNETEPSSPQPKRKRYWIRRP